MTQDPEIAFTFKPVDEHSLERFTEMFKACFDVTVERNYFQWKYLDNPAGRVVAYEALDGLKPAAFYGVIPEAWTSQGRAQPLYQSMDTATHPLYQRRGLFLKLARMTYGALGEAIVIGFPGEQSYSGFVKKLGWEHIHTIEYMFAHHGLFRLQHALARFAPLSFDAVSGMSAELSRFLEDFRPTSPLAKQLSPRYLEWRVFRHPQFRYGVCIIRDQNTAVGCCVYREDTERSCCIEWLGFRDAASYRDYVPAVVGYLFERTRRRYVYTWVPTDLKLRKGYERAGLIRNRTRFGPFRDRMAVIVCKLGGERGPWFDPANYDLQPLSHD